MRAIIGAYVRPVEITQETSFLIGTVGAEGQTVRYRNILSMTDPLEARELEDLLGKFASADFSNFEHFRFFIEKCGYEVFGPMVRDEHGRISSTVGLMFIEAQDRVPEFAVRNLHEKVKAALIRFQKEYKEQWQGLWRMANQAGDQPPAKVRFEAIKSLWGIAQQIGTENLLVESSNPPGAPLVVISCADFRGMIALLTMDYFEKKGSFPAPRAITCVQCGGPISSPFYRGKSYCSPACLRAARQGMEANRIKARLRTRSNRMMQRGEMDPSRRAELLEALRNLTTIEKIEQIARSYGIDPVAKRAGRPRRDQAGR